MLSQCTTKSCCLVLTGRSASNIDAILMALSFAISAHTLVLMEVPAKHALDRATSFRNSAHTTTLGCNRKPP